MTSRKRLPAHRGYTLVVVLVSLGIIAVGSMFMGRSIMATRHLQQRESYREQARWLAESAIDRAVSQHRANPEYRGETWNIVLPDTSNEMHGQMHGRADVLVESTAESDRVSLHVESHFPVDHPDSVRFAKTIQMRIPTQQPGEP